MTRSRPPPQVRRGARRLAGSVPRSAAPPLARPVALLPACALYALVPCAWPLVGCGPSLPYLRSRESKGEHRERDKTTAHGGGRNEGRGAGPTRDGQGRRVGAFGRKRRPRYPCPIPARAGQE